LAVARIAIRVATAGDASLLAKLGHRTFRDAFSAENSESDMVSYLTIAFSHDIQARELADESSVFLIADVDSSAVGYARLLFGPAPACVPGGSPVEIARFYSDSPWIGRGVGPALMTASLDVAARHGCDVAWLSTWKRNTRARAFYSKWGFSVLGEQEFIVGEDVQQDFVMARFAG
jgi:GNAT superfamily N-acetyltransferase